jgi:hypothetical protein
MHLWTNLSNEKQKNLKLNYYDKHFTAALYSAVSTVTLSSENLVKNWINFTNVGKTGIYRQALKNLYFYGSSKYLDILCDLFLAQKNICNL